MDILIGGPERPPSKRMIAQSRAEEEQRRKAGRAGAAASASTAAGQQDEGYWAYMQRQVQERTEKLGLVGDNMEQLEQNSSNWLGDVNKFVNKQKRNAAGGSKLNFLVCSMLFEWVEGDIANLFVCAVIKAKFGF